MALVLVCEGLRGHATLLTSPAWPIAQAVIAGAGLFYAWRQQDELELTPLIVLTVTFQLAWIGLHLAMGVKSDGDSRVVYSSEGHALIAGHYPHSEYPPGAVLLFAFDSLLSGGGSVRAAHAFVMIPFAVLTLVSVWSLRTPGARWLAACVALWPLNAFFWEFKFDLAPTAALAAGLMLATRERWKTSGVALGIGAALKWTPGLTGVALGLWLFRRGQRRVAATHIVALAGTFLLVNLPFLLSSPSAVIYAYRHQGGRGISAESMFYLPPVIGFEHPIAVISHDVGAARGLNIAAELFQVVVVLLVLTAVVGSRSLHRAVAAAAMAPVVFFLSNRVFSPQYLIMTTVGWAIAGALVLADRRQQLMLAALVGVVTLANALVYPTGSRWWPTFSLVLFLGGFAITGWLIVRGGRARPELVG
jgi:Glycosyltransferase family 87